MLEGKTWQQGVDTMRALDAAYADRLQMYAHALLIQLISYSLPATTGTGCSVAWKL